MSRLPAVAHSLQVVPLEMLAEANTPQAGVINSEQASLVG